MREKAQRMGKKQDQEALPVKMGKKVDPNESGTGFEANGER